MNINAYQQSRERKAAKIFATLADFLGPDLKQYACLDVGCAEGIITKTLSSRFRHSIGVDADPEAIRQASDQHANEITAFALTDGQKLPFPPNHFDIIICAQVYEHTPDPVKLVSEIHRTLKPGGAVFFSGPNRFALWEQHYNLPFLSWLPQKVAGHYMRAFGRGRVYDIHPLTARQLQHLLSDFDIYDYTPQLVRNAPQYALDERIPRWVQHVPAKIIKFFKPLIPNYNWILVKRS